MYKENHIGYYIGDGQVIECTVGWGVNSITISQIDSAGRRSRNGVANGTWIYHGMVPWLDYSSYIDEEEPAISDVRYSDVSSTGYTISCTATDNLSVAKVAFPTWTVNNGQDDLPEMFMETQRGKKDGDTYSFYVKASDHNNEQGQYVTHIYAVDYAGNTIKYEVSVDVKEYPDTITLAPSASYSIKDDYLKSVKESTTVDSLLAEFENAGLKVLDKDGNVITGPAKVGTGATVNLYNGTTLVDSVTVVVAGDVDGNGIVDTTDYTRVKLAILRSIELNEAEKAAADVEANNTIDSTDCLRIKSHFLNIYDLYA